MALVSRVTQRKLNRPNVRSLRRLRHSFLFRDQLWCESASFKLFFLPFRLGFPLTGFLSLASALKVLLDPGKVHLAFIGHRETVVFGGDQDVAPGLLPLVEHLLH